MASAYLCRDMNIALKKKLCWNCDASVSKTQSNCPYCGVYLHRSEDEPDSGDQGSEDNEEEELQEENLAPPYLMNAVNSGKQDKFHTPPYAVQPEQTTIPPSTADDHEPIKENLAPMKYALLALTSLILGVVSLLFSLILLFFSSHGVLTLRWSAELWYLYLAISIPLLIVGWFSLKHIKE
jgi:hypothetical protein